VEELTRTLLDNAPYLGLFIILMLTGLGLPLPEDIPLLFAGALCGIGHANIYIMLPVAIFSVVGSDCLCLYLGSRYGHHIPNLPVFKQFLTQKKLAQAEAMFAKHGGKSLFISRFMPGLRAALFFSAGLFKVPMWKLLVFDGGAALLSVPLWVLLAYFFAENWTVVKKMARRMQYIITTVVILAVTGFVAWQIIKRKKKKKEPKALPEGSTVEPKDGESKPPEPESSAPIESKGSASQSPAGTPGP